MRTKILFSKSSLKQFQNATKLWVWDHLHGKKEYLITSTAWRPSKAIWLSFEKAGMNIIVSNLEQHFRKSGTKTVSWIVAEGELAQFDQNFVRLERSQMRHRMLHDLYQSQTATVLIERCDNFPEPHLDGNYCQFGGCSGIGSRMLSINLILI